MCVHMNYTHYIFHIHKHARVDTHEGTLPFSTSSRNPWLASFISRAHLTSSWACRDFEAVLSQSPLPTAACPVARPRGHQRAAAPQRQPHVPLQAQHGGHWWRRNRILLLPHLDLSCPVRVFVFRLLTALLQGVNPHAQTRVAYGRFPYFVFGEQLVQWGHLQIGPSWHSFDVAINK